MSLSVSTKNGGSPESWQKLEERMPKSLELVNLPIAIEESLRTQATATVGVLKYPVHDRAKDTRSSPPEIYSLHKPTVHVYGGLPVNERSLLLEEHVALAVDMLPVERGWLIL